MRSAGVSPPMSMPKAARDRGAHLVAVEHLAFDLARFQDILGQRLQHGFRPQLEAEAFHPADQTPLPVPDIDEARSDTRVVPAESRPVVCSWI